MFDKITYEIIVGAIDGQIYNFGRYWFGNIHYLNHVFITNEKRWKTTKRFLDKIFTQKMKGTKCQKRSSQNSKS